MKTNDRELKRAYREYVANNSEMRREGCPAPEDIWTLFVGRNSRKRKAGMVDHLTACSSCYQVFEAFLEMSRAEGSLVRELQSRFPGQSRKPPLPMVWRYATAFLVATVILAAAVLSTKWLGPAKPPEERGRLSGQLRLLAPGQKPALRSPLLFRWEEVSRSEYYIVEIFDDSFRPFWKSGQLTGTSYELPSTVKEKMETGKSYFWMLTAFSKNGAKTESSLEKFRLID